MISFRYHLVTIVGVFLALGLGVLAGTTVVDQALVNGLRTQIQGSNERVEELKSRVGELERQDALVEEMLPALEADQLSGQEVILVSSEGGSEEAITEIRQTLTNSGAVLRAHLEVTNAVLAPDEAGALRKLVGLSAAQEVPAATATLLATRLSGGPDPVAEEDVLNQLLSGGFVVSRKPEITEADLPSVGGQGELVVVLGSRAPDPAVERFLVPFSTALVDDSVMVGAVEGALDLGRYVPMVREDPELDGRVVTVDNVDEAVGGYGLVLGLRDLIATGVGGDFGFKPGATALYPPRAPA